MKVLPTIDNETIDNEVNHDTDGASTRRTLLLGLAASLGLLAGGCVVAPLGPPRLVHGYRWRHPHGHWMTYDSHLGVYVVVGRPYYYYWDGVFFSYSSGVWRSSPRLNGRRWRHYRRTHLPPGLRRYRSAPPWRETSPRRPPPERRRRRGRVPDRRQGGRTRWPSEAGRDPRRVPGPAPRQGRRTPHPFERPRDSQRRPGPDPRQSQRSDPRRRPAPGPRVQQRTPRPAVPPRRERPNPGPGPRVEPRRGRGRRSWETN